MGGTALARIECGCDHLQHPIDIGEDIIVPEAKDTIALRLEIGGSLGVTSRDGVGCVLSAVEFDDDTFRVAGEIREVRTDRRLTTPV